MIRRAAATDMPVMLGISQRSFETPWSVASFEAEFYKNYSHVYLYTKAEPTGLTAKPTGSAVEQPVAYLIVWNIQNEGEIVSLAVDRGWRNKGIGTSLLNFAFTSHQVNIWHLEVDPENRAAISLYEKHCFRKDRIIRNYYGQGKDAIQMSRVTN